MSSINTSFVDLLHSFTTGSSNLPFNLPNNDKFEANNDVGFDECISQHSEASSNSKSDVEDDSSGVSEDPVQSYSQGVTNFMNDFGHVRDDDDALEFQNNGHIDFLSERVNKNQVK